MFGEDSSRAFDNFSVSRGVGLPSRSDVTDGINNQFYTPRLGTCLVRKFESTVGLFAEQCVFKQPLFELGNIAVHQKEKELSGDSLQSRCTLNRIIRKKDVS